MKKFIISFVISSIAFALIFTGIGKGKFFNANSEASVEDGYIIEDEDGTKQTLKVKNELLFLMMGVDAKDVTKSKGTRTDTMMLIKANFDTGETSLLSLPRDTRVLVKGEEDKLNHAHAYGGSDLTMRTVRDFTGLDVDYYVKVDYRAVKGIVEAIGGVEIDVPVNMKYTDTYADPPLKINIGKGFQTLDGQNAHDFLRFRSGDGDLGRIDRQQYFLKELMKQTLRPKNITKLPKLIETYYDYVETNIPLSVMLKGALSANKMDVENLNTKTIPGEPKKIGGIDYLIYNRVETTVIIQEMFGDYLLSQ